MRIAYDAIVLREQTAVLHPEHLYNAMDHHYEMMRVSSIVYVTSPLLFYILCFTYFCMLLYSVMLHVQYAAKVYNINIFCL